MIFAPTYPKRFQIDTNGVCDEVPLPNKLPAINAEFMKAFKFLNGNARIKNLTGYKLGSYRFKHILENELKCSLTNGQTILIMSSLGFKCKRDGNSPNCQFNCDFK